jgi:chromosomal replication initiator protein
VSTATSRQDVCARITRRLEQRVGSHRYKMWFDRNARFDYHDHTRRLHVTVPNRFVADWIGRHFEADLRHVADDEVGQGVHLEVRVEPHGFAVAPMTAPAQHTTAPATVKVVTESARRRASSRHDGHAAPADYRHRLEDFIVGPSNELAHAAASRLADEDAHHAGHHPTAGGGHTLFIHGGCGLGKTHLLQGICRRVLERRPDARVLYTTGEHFTNEFLTAIRTNKIDTFRRRIRRLDLLAVDDVHFIANKSATQQEFLHSFDALELGGARVVLASDNHPKLIHAFSDALVSRCVRGMVVEVQRPDLVTRVRIIQAIAARRGLTIVEAVTRTLAERCHGSVRDIEGAITKLHAMAHLLRQSSRDDAASDSHVVSPALVDRLFDSLPAPAPRRIVRFDAIVSVTCEQLGVTAAQIMGAGRSRHVVLARSIVVLMAREMTPMSYPEIAAAMGRNNHSTVITAAQRLTRQLDTDRALVLPGRMEQTCPRQLVERIREALAHT